MKLSFAVLCFALLASAIAFNIHVKDQHKQSSDDDRVKIDFFYESLCPYCQQFMEKALKIASNTKDFWKICDFKLYPYGNARRARNGTDDWSYTCQHGTRECEGNFIETCALKLYPDQYQDTLNFVLCLESNTNDWTVQGKKCASQYNLDWSKINSCATSKQGRNLNADFAEVTEKLVPAHTYVPWVVVNNAHSSTTESAVENNMVKYVCATYKGSIKIDACN